MKSRAFNKTEENMRCFHHSALSRVLFLTWWPTLPSVRSPKLNLVATLVVFHQVHASEYGKLIDLRLECEEST